MTKQMGFCIFLFLYETTLLQVDCVGVPLVSTLDLRLTLQVDCVVGVPLSCRFFMRGEPPHKNAACGYPGSTVNTSIFKLVQDVSLYKLGNCYS
jgi:hypothetical protein